MLIHYCHSNLIWSLANSGQSVCAQNEHLLHASCRAPSSSVFLWELEHMQGNLSPQAPMKCYSPYIMRTTFWPLTALTAPLAPPHPPISGLQTWGLYWLVWDRPPQGILLILAALPPSQEDNLLWLPSISHLLALSLFLSLSLFCRFPLHSGLLLHDLHHHPHHHHNAPNPIHPLAFFLLFSPGSSFLFFF